MNIFPAIDLYDGKAVRLYKGNYSEMTVYSDDPLSIAKDFESSGARFMHVVDLEGAKTGGTPNIETIKRLVENTSLFVEVGGGIRSMDVVDKYLSSGVGRVILGTAALENEQFLREAVAKYGERIAVGIDIKDGFVAVRGWVEKSQVDAFDFCQKVQDVGVKTVICTDISKDGAMKGTNHELYEKMSKQFSLDIIASGGVSSIDDVKRLREKNLYGAIIGKAYYTGAINLKEAIEVSR